MENIFGSSFDTSKFAFAGDTGKSKMITMSVVDNASFEVTLWWQISSNYCKKTGWSPKFQMFISLQSIF
jgi:hypothetical protein